MRSWLFTISPPPPPPPALPIAVKPRPSLKSMHIAMSKITKKWAHVRRADDVWCRSKLSARGGVGVGGVNSVAPLNVSMHVCWSTTAFVPLTGWWIRSPGWWPGWFGCLFWSGGALVPACPGGIHRLLPLQWAFNSWQHKDFFSPPPSPPPPQHITR